MSNTNNANTKRNKRNNKKPETTTTTTVVNRKGYGNRRGGGSMAKRVARSRNNGIEINKITVPVSRGFRTRNRNAELSMTDGVMTIKHSEYIGDIILHETFAQQSIPINPGNSSMFSWLSSIATSFDKYYFADLRFHYRARCPTSTAGTVMLRVEYNPNNPPQTDKRDFMTGKSASSNAWGDCTFSCALGDANSTVKERLVGRSDVIETDQLPLYDVGYLQVATQGAASAPTGELHVSYLVHMRLPDKSVGSADYKGTLMATEGGEGQTAAKPWGTAISQVVGDPGVTYDGTGTNSKFTFSRPAKMGVFVLVDGTTLVGTQIFDTGNSTGYTLVGSPIYFAKGDATEIFWFSLLDVEIGAELVFRITSAAAVTDAAVYFFPWVWGVDTSINYCPLKKHCLLPCKKHHGDIDLKATRRTKLSLDDQVLVVLKRFFGPKVDSNVIQGKLEQVLNTAIAREDYIVMTPKLLSPMSKRDLPYTEDDIDDILRSSVDWKKWPTQFLLEKCQCMVSKSHKFDTDQEKVMEITRKMNKRQELLIGQYLDKRS